MKIKLIAKDAPKLYSHYYKIAIKHKYPTIEYTKAIKYSIETSFEDKFYKRFKISELIKDGKVDMFLLGEILKYGAAFKRWVNYLFLLLEEKEKQKEYIIFSKKKTYEFIKWRPHPYESHNRVPIAHWVNTFRFTKHDSILLNIEEKGWWKEEDFKIIKEALSLVKMDNIWTN
jgi:hypothetical protein